MSTNHSKQRVMAIHNVLAFLVSTFKNIHENQVVVTVIEIGTETAVFRQNRTEPKPRFYASLLAVSKTEQL